MAVKIERRNYDMEFSVRLARIEENIFEVKDHLNKINGSISDYQVTKDRLTSACDDIKIIKPLLTTMQIKFYTIVGFTALFTGAIGSAIGAAIVRATTGG